MAKDRSSEIYGKAVDRLVSRVTADQRVRALWLEGDSLKEVRRPYRRLEAHLACDEPDFPAVLADMESLIAPPESLAAQRWSDTPRFARKLEALLEGLPIAVVIEKTSLLAKRPRSAVLPLVDKTGHLCHVMDFSRAGA
jgi:hypothetical protein